MAMTQGEAVYMAVREVFPQGAVPSTTTWTDEQKRQVHAIVFSLFKAGEVNKTSGGSDDASLMKYIPGLVNNWVRKDKRLNGGTTYVPKNPGSRSGSGDEILKNLKLLYAAVTDPDAKVAVQQEIDKRMLELKPKIELDISKLPEHLLKFVKR